MTNIWEKLASEGRLPVEAFEHLEKKGMDKKKIDKLRKETEKKQGKYVKK